MARVILTSECIQARIQVSELGGGVESLQVVWDVNSRWVVWYCLYSRGYS